MSRSGGGMTLIEILVASALGVLVIALTWTTFTRAKATVNRATARVNLHQSAAVLQDAFERDFGNLAPALAMFVASTPAATATTRSEDVSVVFMRSVAPLDKQTTQGSDDRYLADHMWVRWRYSRSWELIDGTWKVTASALKRSSSSPMRLWNTNSTLTVSPAVTDPKGGASKGHYGGTQWLNLPRPLRDASAGLASLDFNRYGLPATAISADTPVGDIGDLADLDTNEQIASTQILDFQFGWLRADGGADAVDGRNPAVRNIDGLYMDVVGPDNGRYLDARQDPVASPPGAVLQAGQPQYDYRPVLGARPRLVRIAFRLKDQATQVDQAFSFSIPVPGQMPPVDQPSP